MAADRKEYDTPTRLARYCCSELKEHGGAGRLRITGVRKKESARRAKQGGLVKIIGKPATVEKKAVELGAEVGKSKKGGLILNMDNDPSRRLVEHCYRTTSTMLNPIIEWADTDVWDFLKAHGCKSNPLYECGFKRVGCIGCPVAGKNRYAEFERWPKYRALYVMAFDRMLEARRRAGKKITDQWLNGESVMRWWLGEDGAQILWEDLGL